MFRRGKVCGPASTTRPDKHRGEEVQDQHGEPQQRGVTVDVQKTKRHLGSYEVPESLTEPSKNWIAIYALPQPHFAEILVISWRICAHVT